MNTTTIPTTARKPTRPAGAPEYRLVPVDSHTVRIDKWDGAQYRIGLNAHSSPITCTCLGFHNRRFCKHLGMTHDALAHKHIILPAPDETVACDSCWVGVPLSDALPWDGPTGTRLLCPSCYADLLCLVDETNLEEVVP